MELGVVDGRGFRLRHVMAVTMLDQPKYDARRRIVHSTMQDQGA
jgi:hypothetical protein